jgi:Neisseria meningitidis TspB protein
MDTPTMKLASIILIYAFVSPVFAGYAYPKPPPTWKPNPSGAGGLYQSPRSAMRDGANNNWYTSTGSVYLPGAGDIKYPLAFKEAANASRFAASRTFVPLALSQMAFSILKDWLSTGTDLYWDETDGLWKWKEGKSPAQQGEYQFFGSSWGSPSSACNAGAATYCSGLGYPATGVGNLINSPTGIQCTATCSGTLNGNPFEFSTGNLTKDFRCPVGWTQVGLMCVSSQPQTVTQPEFEDAVAPLKIPVELPPLLPFPLPVEDPRTNPNPFPFGDPNPFFVPTGDPYPAPQPRPDPDPYPYVEPGIQANPSPTPDTPFRLDLKPVVKPKPDTTPTPNPNPTPTPNPSPTPTPTPNPSPAPTPDKDPGLCALFPDILACEKLGEAPDAPELDNENKETPLTRQDGFGASNGSCPADKQITLSAGLVLKMPFTLICDFASKIRPLVLAFASLAAAFIFVGAMKNK